MAEDPKQTIDKVLYALGWLGRYQWVPFVILNISEFPLCMHMFSVIFLARFNDYTCASLESEDLDLKPNDIFGNSVYTLTTGGNGNGTFASDNSSLIAKYFGVDITDIEAWNVSVNYGKCDAELKNGSDVISALKKCPKGYKFVKAKETSIMSDFDLVCGQEALIGLIHSIQIIGMLAGNAIFPMLSDLIGRKPVLKVLLHLLLFTGVGLAFAPNFTFLLVVKFFLGVFLQGADAICLVMVLEMMPAERRSLPSIVGGYVWSTSLLINLGVSYALRNYSWRYLAAAYGLSAFYAVFTFWRFDESFRWLLEKQKMNELKRIVTKAAKCNKVDPKSVLAIIEEDEKCTRSADGVASDTSFLDNGSSVPHDDNYGNEQKDEEIKIEGLPKQSRSSDSQNNAKRCIISSLRNPKILLTVSVSAFMWFSNMLTYYGITMLSGSLTSNLYLEVTLNMLMDLPGNIIFTFLIQRFPRKTFITILNLSAALFLGLTAFLKFSPLTSDLPGIQIAVVCTSLLGKLSNIQAFFSLYIFVPELLPTSFRNTGIGIALFGGRLGSMLSPYARTFGRHVPWGPAVVFGSLCLMIPLLVRLLPETRGRQLAQNVDDLELLFMKTKKKESEDNRDIVT